MKRYQRLILLCSLLLTAAVCSITALQQEQAAMAERLIRLHVVANSDSSADQAVKLAVRDAVLEEAETALRVHQNPRAALMAAIPQLQAAAENCLRENGFDRTVQISLKKERFPTSVYDSFSLPAGVYPSLRVVIGEGKGHNWWCVVFPSICLRAVSEMETAAVSAGFTDQEIRMITHPQDYAVKFKILELLEQIQNWLT